MAGSAGKSIRTVALLALLAFSGGCETLQQTDETLIGTLRVSGNAVFLNGRQATDGASVHVNDSVTTGAASSAMIEYVGDGFIQLDENTDPVFSFRIVAAGNRRCIHVLLQFGQVFIDKDLQCFDTPNAAGALGSRVNIKVTRDRSRDSVITVMSGKVSMTRPRVYPVYASQQTVVPSAGRAPQIRTLSQPELDRTVKWREKYSFADQSDEYFGPMLIHRPLLRPGPMRMPTPKPAPAPAPRDYPAPR